MMFSFSQSNDVFLSFLGENSGKTFTDHLYQALINSGYRTYYQGQKPIDLEIEKAEVGMTMTESKVAIIVFAKNYIESEWCVEELAKIMDWKHSNPNGAVIPIFYDDVSPQQVIDSFEKYHQGQKPKATISFSSSPIYQLQHGSEAVFIQKILKDVFTLSNQHTTPLNVPSYSVGIQSRLKEVDFWVKDSSTDISMVAISGMGGTGKTTLAKILYNMNSSSFEATSFLLGIREASKQEYGLENLRYQLISDIHSAISPKLDKVDEGNLQYEDVLYKNCCLVILDDVDQIKQFNFLISPKDWFFKYCKIIITTSRERLFTQKNQKHKTFRIKPLDDYESIRLFSLYAFSQDRPFQGHMELSQRIVQLCKGCPLSLELLGSTLSGKTSGFWETALNKLEAIKAPKDYYCFTPSRTKTETETLTTEGSLLFKNEACGKRKRLDDYDDVSTPTSEEKPRLFKRLLCGLFSFLKPATSWTKIPTEPGSSPLLISMRRKQAGWEFMESRKAGWGVPSLLDDTSAPVVDDDDDHHDDGSSMCSSGSSDALMRLMQLPAGCGKPNSVAMSSNGSEVQVPSD